MAHVLFFYALSDRCCHSTVSSVPLVAHMHEEICNPWMLSFPLAGPGELLPVNLQQRIHWEHYVFPHSTPLSSHQMGYKEQWIEDLKVNVYNLYIFLEISKRGNLGYHLCGCCENLAYICIELFKKWQMRNSMQYGFTDIYLILIFPIGNY